MKKIIMFILSLTSCSNTNCDWAKGEIVEFGTYCNSEFRVKVYEENNFLKYEAVNKDDEILIQQDMNISIFQHWGLFLDSENNFWVFSSDVGISVWKKDSVTGNYTKMNFDHKVARNDVPEEIYESSLKRFLK